LASASTLPAPVSDQASESLKLYPMLTADLLIYLWVVAHRHVMLTVLPAA